ncbi:ABC transporter ATP-binding protein [Thermodesulfobacteriota bacterium]
MFKKSEPFDMHSNSTINIQAWQYYSRLFKGFSRLLVICIAASIGQSLLLLPIPLFVRHIFDQTIPSGDYYFLGVAGGIIFLLYFLNGGVSLWTRHVFLKTTKVAILRFRSKILRKLYTLSRTHYSEVDREKLHASLVQDTERLDIMSNALASQFIPSLMISITLAGVLLYLSWILFLVSLSAVPIFLLASKFIGKRVKRRIHDFHRTFEVFSKGALFVLQMMDLTRIQSAEKFEVKRQEENFEELRVISGQMAWLRSAYILVQTTIVAATGALVLIVGGIAVVKDVITIGNLLSFYAAAVLFRNQLYKISYSIPQIFEGNQSLATLYNFMQIQDSRPYSGNKRIDFKGTVTLENVSFQYRDTRILYQIDLTVHPNQMVALVGPNGAGKSTIVNLILGFYRPQEGGLFADGCPYDGLDVVHFRRQVGVVTQDPIIFPGTVLENITYGSPEADTAEVVRAAELAIAHDFILRLPEGYDTFVGERGILLSGGQRQRIAVARALLRRPQLLILDEPTHHLDKIGVLELMGNLKRIEQVPSVLIISHDVDILDEADQFYYLKEGRVVDNWQYNQQVLYESKNN